MGYLVKELCVINCEQCKDYFLFAFGKHAICIIDEGQLLPYDKKYKMSINFLTFTGKSSGNMTILIEDRYTFKFMKIFSYLKYYFIKLFATNKYYGDVVQNEVID